MWGRVTKPNVVAFDDRPSKIGLRCAVEGPATNQKAVGRNADGISATKSAGMNFIGLAPDV